MKYSIILLFLLSFNVFSKNTLTLNIEGEKTTKDIQKIEIQDEGILISSDENFKCFLEFSELESNTPKSSNCATCVEEYTERMRFSEMFTNAKNAKIECDINKGKVIGFGFLGNTTHRGQGTLTKYGRVFNMEEFDPRFSGEKKPGKIEKTIQSVERVLLKLLF